MSRIFCRMRFDAFLAGLSLGVVGSYLLYMLYRSTRKRQSLLSTLLNLIRTDVPEVDVDEAVQFYYAEPDFNIPAAEEQEIPSGFAARCALLCERHTDVLKDFSGELDETTCLDIGCSVGGTTFELSRCFHHVLGIDPSEELIETAKRMKIRRRLDYTTVTEGNLKSFQSKAILSPNRKRKENSYRCHEHLLLSSHVLSQNFKKTDMTSLEVHSVKLDDEVDVEGVRFRKEDPCKLPEFNSVDCILSALLLHRLQQPKAFLESLPRLLKRDGTCVFVSCYDPDVQSMKHPSSHEALSEEEFKEFMTELGLELVHEENLPFMRKQSARKYEWNIGHATVWRHQIRSSIL